jgi:hypothetical protein
MVPDEHGSRYALASLHYDSPDLRCYWEKATGYASGGCASPLRDNEPLTEETPVRRNQAAGGPGDPETAGRAALWRGPAAV